MNTTEKMYHPETGEEMIRDTRPYEITYKEQHITIDMPGWYCISSDDAIFTQEDMKIYDKAFNRLKAKVEKLLLPEEIRATRKMLNLTQHAAGIRLGGGINAFQKYESGESLPSRAISNLLKLLAQQPSLVSML